MCFVLQSENIKKVNSGWDEGKKSGETRVLSSVLCQRLFPQWWYFVKVKCRGYNKGAKPIGQQSINRKSQPGNHQLETTSADGLRWQVSELIKSLLFQLHCRVTRTVISCHSHHIRTNSLLSMIQTNRYFGVINWGLGSDQMNTECNKKAH